MTNEPTQLERDIARSKSMPAGGDHYRAYIGPAYQFDFMGAAQFNLLTTLGLCEDHTVVDLGCGALRSGRFLLQYLLPTRYIGIDPNEWLWQSAIEAEIGADIQEIKLPKFFVDDSLQFVDVPDQSVDFIVAQSIYSHTGVDLFAPSLKAARSKLTSRGQFLFTVIHSKNTASATMGKGAHSNGWIYPQCVVFDETEVMTFGTDAGLIVQKLPWFHPRQTWYRAVCQKDMMLTDQMIADMGTGRPLFDPRF